MLDYNDPRLAAPSDKPAALGRIGRPNLPILTALEDRAERVSTGLLGEPVEVYRERDDFLLIRHGLDHYVGWVKKSGVKQDTAVSHRISVPMTYAFSKPDIKSAPQTTLFLNSFVAANPAENGLCKCEGLGWVPESHLLPIDGLIADPAEMAVGFFGTPYLWGGRDALGLDCSGLTQTVFAVAGIQLPRDTDMQFAWSGEAIENWQAPGALRRNDLVFWKGHVGLMLDGETLLHANAHHMAVAHETLAGAIARISGKYGQPIGAKRISLADRARPDWLGDTN
jgi:hypothetical protein